MTDPKRICQTTGLALVSSTGQLGHRIAKTSYGPLNPPLRKSASERAEWGRYDVLEHRTIYAGTPAKGAYAESVAFARTAIDIDSSDLFDDGSEFESLEDIVAKEWADRHHMQPGQLAAGWRQERLIHKLTLPQTGWFVDIEDSASIASIVRNLTASLSMSGVEQLTTSHLRGEDRSLTTNISQWIHSRTLDDGSLPLGIQYGSKHDSNWTNWAIWLRAIDDGKDASLEPTRSDAGTLIGDPAVDNKDLRSVCDLFNIHCH